MEFIVFAVLAVLSVAATIVFLAKKANSLSMKYVYPKAFGWGGQR